MYFKIPEAKLVTEEFSATNLAEISQTNSSANAIMYFS